MHRSRLIADIRDEYGDCCLTDSYRESDCGIDITGLNPSSLATIHGSQNQLCLNHRKPGKLCDRLIFGSTGREFICAVEIKAGKSPEVSQAIRQIQSGLDLVREILQNQILEGWYPLLVCRGSVGSNGARLLNTKTVSYGGKKKRVKRIGCGGRLRDVLVP